MGDQPADGDNGAQRKPRRFSWRGLLYSVVSILVPLMLFATVVIAAQGTPQPSCIHETKPDLRSVSPDEQPISQSGSLAKQYEPTVKMSILDRFWPVSVESVLREQSSLGAGVSYVSGNRTVEPATAANLTALDVPAAYLDFPASLTDKSAQMRAYLRGINVPAATIDAWPTNLGSYAQKSAQIYFYDAGMNCTFAGRSLQGYHALEYWFFYPLNYYPLTVNTTQMLSDPLRADSADIDFHEGDWEHITVLLASGNVPKYVWMARHSSEGVLLPWAQVQKDADGHPIVYPAFGGHPSYPDCGAHARSLLAAAVYDYVVCGPGLYTFSGATTPLVDLVHVSWSCWPGHFGTTVGTQGTSNADDPTGAILVAGPGSPLRQGENKDACPPKTG